MTSARMPVCIHCIYVGDDCIECGRQSKNDVAFIESKDIDNSHILKEVKKLTAAIGRKQSKLSSKYEMLNGALQIMESRLDEMDHFPGSFKTLSQSHLDFMSSINRKIESIEHKPSPTEKILQEAKEAKARFDQALAEIVAMKRNEGEVLNTLCQKVQHIENRLITLK